MSKIIVAANQKGGVAKTSKLVVGVPEDIKEHCSALIGSDIHYAEPSHTLFDDKVNESIYNEVTADYKE